MLDVAATLNGLPASVLAPCSVPNTAATGPLSIHTSDHILPPPPPLLLQASNSFPPPPSGYKVATSGYKAPQGPAPVFSLTPSNSLSLSCCLIQPCWPILFLKYPRGAPTSGPLHWLLALPVFFLPQISAWQAPASPSHLYSNTTFSGRPSPITTCNTPFLNPALHYFSSSNHHWAS